MASCHRRAACAEPAEPADLWRSLILDESTVNQEKILGPSGTCGTRGRLFYAAGSGFIQSPENTLGAGNAVAHLSSVAYWPVGARAAPVTKAYIVPFELSPTRLAFGLVVLVFFAIRVAAWRDKRRALRELPPNASEGMPVAHSTRERISVALFCCFVAGLIAWLW